MLIFWYHVIIKLPNRVYQELTTVQLLNHICYQSLPYNNQALARRGCESGFKVCVRRTTYAYRPCVCHSGRCCNAVSRQVREAFVIRAFIDVQFARRSFYYSIYCGVYITRVTPLSVPWSSLFALRNPFTRHRPVPPPQIHHPTATHVPKGNLLSLLFLLGIHQSAEL